MSDFKKEICHIKEWCSQNRMKINELKTQLMHVSVRKPQHRPSIQINDVPIAFVDSARLLGLTMQSNLKRNFQIAHAITKASKLLFPLLQLKRANIHPSLLLKVYCIMVRPHLTYASPVMSNMTQQDVRKLCKTEKRLLRIVGVEPEMVLKQFLKDLEVKLHDKQG